MSWFGHRARKSRPFGVCYLVTASVAFVFAMPARPGTYVRALDGGEHWHALMVTRDHGWIPYGISFISETHGWVGGSTGGFETSDGGATWHRTNMGFSTNKMRVLSRPDGGHRVLAIGQDLRRLDLPPEP